MQKVLQRAQRAKSRYQSKRRKQAAINHRIDTHLYILEQQAINTDKLALIRSARERRKEDSRLGPLLAPRRDVNFEGKDKAYGTVSLRLLRGPEKPRREEMKDWGIREADRVCVTEKGHRDYGKVGVVREVRERAEECFVKGINLVDVPTPAANLVLYPQIGPITTTEASIPLSSVRLVAPLPDPATGLPKDQLINSLTVSTEHRRLSKGRPSRWITGLDPPTAIPWPDEAQSESDPQEEDHSCDTLRIDVEQRTWIPTLLKQPFPTGVIDELRNKYGQFRTRHEESFIEKIERKERFEREVEEKLKLSAMTPKERWAREIQRRKEEERQERIDRGEKLDEPSEEVLRKIGELMRRKREDVMRVKGLEEQRERLEWWRKGEGEEGGVVTVDDGQNNVPVEAEKQEEQRVVV